MGNSGNNLSEITSKAKGDIFLSCPFSMSAFTGYKKWHIMKIGFAKSVLIAMWFQFSPQSMVELS